MDIACGRMDAWDGRLGEEAAGGADVDDAATLLGAAGVAAAA